MKVEDKIRIFDWLKDNNYLEYGTIIPREVLENLFRADFQDGWEFLTPFLAMKMYLEEEGYMCTSENQDRGCLKIYDADEIATQVNRIVVNSFKRLRRAQKCMTNTKMENLGYPEMKKHLHENNKLQCILYSIRDKLKDLNE